MGSLARNYTDNTVKQLYGLSGNACANPECRKILIENGIHLGEIAHISAVSPNGPRYDPNMDDNERRDYKNLILLCPECHNKIDTTSEDYPIELLYSWKKNHEKIVVSNVYKNYLNRLNKLLNSSEIKKQDINITEKLYSSTIYIQEGDEQIEKTGCNILQDHICELIKNKSWDDFPNIFLSAVAGMGKSTELKMLYNTLLDIFSDINNYDNYQFNPICYFFELKNFQIDFFKKYNESDYIFLFLDGLDEVPGDKYFEFIKYIKNLLCQYSNIKIIIAGRESAFNQELDNTFHDKVLKIQLSSDFDINSSENCILYNQYKNSPLLELIKIPFYRNVAEQNSNIKTYKEFYREIIKSKLKDDQHKSEYALGFNPFSSKKINIDKIIKKLSHISYEKFKEKTSVFTESFLKEKLGSDYEFVIKSSLIKYESKNCISFVSNIFFEYFVALFFLTQPISFIQKDLFLVTGRINIKYLNIIGIILSLLEHTDKKYSILSKKLKKQSNTFILLTDFEYLSGKEKFSYFLDILDEYNRDKRLIYYSRFSSTHDILSNIDSLSNAMDNLLIDEYKTLAVRNLTNTIKKFLLNPNDEKIFEFANAVILLDSSRNKIWEKEQEKIIKTIAVDTIDFFLNNPLAIKLKGILSYSSILHWYAQYNWSSNWGKDEWEHFIQSFIKNSESLYSFTSETDFNLKLNIFNSFYSNNSISKLVKPLLISILSRSSTGHRMAVAVPHILDDTFKTPVIESNIELFIFSEIIKKEKIICVDDVIDIILDLVKNDKLLSVKGYEEEKLFDLLKEMIKTDAQNISFSKKVYVYQIIKYFIDKDKNWRLHSLVEYLRNLNDELKVFLLHSLLDDYRDVEILDNFCLWYIFAPLLNLNDKQMLDNEIKNIEKKMTKKQIGDIILFCLSHFSENQYLQQKCNELYPKYLQDLIDREENIKNRTDKISQKIDKMLNNEAKLILDKNKIESELSKIQKYLKKCEKQDDKISEIYSLHYKRILEDIKYNKDYEESPIFSEFVIKMLESVFRWIDDKSDFFTATQKYIDYFFLCDKYFWRFFFLFYINNYSKEEVQELLKNNASLYNKIIETCKTEVLEYIKSDTLNNYDGGLNEFWVTPFVHFIDLFFESKIPSWIQKDEIIYFMFYPAWNLNTEYYSSSSDFKWLAYDSVFDWLNNVCGISYDVLISFALNNYATIENVNSKAQVIYFFANNYDKFPKYKEKILALILAETEKEVNSRSENITLLNSNALQLFWQNTKENLSEFVLNNFNWKYYSSDDNNYCRVYMILHFLRFANETQKRILIKKVSFGESNENKENLLVKLGDIKCISKQINYYLKNGNLNNSYGLHSYTFGNLSPSTKLLKAFIKLYIYSLEKSNNRREVLHGLAREGIKNNLTEKNFIIFHRRLLKIIKRKRKQNEYFEGIMNYINEMEQYVFYVKKYDII